MGPRYISKYWWINLCFSFSCHSNAIHTIILAWWCRFRCWRMRIIVIRLKRMPIVYFYFELKWIWHTTTIVDFDKVTGFNIPQSSNLISSSFSEIISKISFIALNFCLLDISSKKNERQEKCFKKFLSRFSTDQRPMLFLSEQRFVDCRNYWLYRWDSMGLINHSAD